MAGVPRDLRWRIVPLIAFSISAVAALGAGLLSVAEIPAAGSTVLVAFLLAACGLAVGQAPRFLLDPCEYFVTDRRVVWRRGPFTQSIERRAITFARVHWHRKVPGVGHLELVRAVPFGPLSRTQRILLHDVVAPDRLLSLVRRSEPGEHGGYADVKLTDRLDQSERVLWGGAPDGLRMGRAEVFMAALGVVVAVVGVLYAYRTVGVLLALESVGLPVRSWTWLMLFAVMLISGAIILGTGGFLVWQGVWGARAGGSRTEYLLTDTRLIIRRDRTELSVERGRIVDVADLPSSAGSRNLHLILDAPNARALDHSGALSLFSVPRAVVAPVLYEVRDMDALRRLLLEGETEPPPLKEVA